MAYIILYSVVFLILLVMSLLKKNSSQSFCMFVIALLLVCFSGFRSEVGVDYAMYKQLFQSVAFGESVYFEKANIWLIKLIYDIGGEHQLFFFIYALLTVFFTFEFIKYFSVNYFYSVLIYLSFGMYYFASMNQIRQYLAVSIFLYSLKYIYERSLLKYSLFICLAAIFHKSSIILWFLYFFLNRTISFNIYVIVGVLYLVCLNWVTHLADVFGYGFYLRSEAFMSERAGLIIYVFIGINFLLLIMKNRVVKYYKQATIFFNMAYISTLLMLGSVITDMPDILFFRMNNFFVFYLIILFPFAANSFKSKSLFYFVCTCMLIFTLFYYTFSIYINGVKYNLLPYNMNLILF
ncbi:EpsG family protein [Seleniivibrio woodruffii]|uniref:EpsG family protein n=1 Tax=Seleniivibrio woodruffii TaxID=1078050 RepID=UPI003C6F5EFB